VSELEDLIAEYLFDAAILGHGWSTYMRDYMILVEPISQKARGRFLLRFTHCPEASSRTTVADETWHSSWPDHFIDYSSWQDAGEPEGFVWGVNYSVGYPGPKLVGRSPAAAEWSKRFGKPMREFTLETEAFHLRLVFHSLVVEKVSDEVSVIDKIFIPLRG
jgi:hypothetical protein